MSDVMNWFYDHKVTMTVHLLETLTSFIAGFYDFDCTDLREIVANNKLKVSIYVQGQEMISD